MKSRRIRSIIAAFCSVAMFSACDVPDIGGVWESVDYGDGPYFFGHYAYLEDGRKCTVLFEVLESGVEITAFLNNWELEGDILTITYGPNNGTVREGYSSKSRIDEVTDTRLVSTLVESDYAIGTSEVNIRLPDVDPSRVCSVVYKVLDLPDPLEPKPETQRQTPAG